jgi:hypothetical protein
VCSRSEILTECLVQIPKLSFIHRGSAFTFEAITKLFFSSYVESNIFQPFPNQPIGEDLKKLSDQGSFPYYAEGLAWFDIVRIFVSEWFEKAGDKSLEDEYAVSFFRALQTATRGQKYQVPPLITKESKIDALAQMIWTVTAYHETVGTVVEYTRLPSFMGFRAVEDPTKTTTDLQSYLIASIVTASTSIRMPMLVGNFENFFGKAGAPAWEIDVWANFQRAIQEQSKKVREADEKRTTEYKSMDPARFECAVSV